MEHFRKNKPSSDTGNLSYFIVDSPWIPPDLKNIVIQSAREAAAYQNELDLRVQSESLQKMIDEDLQVNEVKDVNEFRKVLEDWKTSYVQEKGPGWVDLCNKIIAIE